MIGAEQAEQRLRDWLRMPVPPRAAPLRQGVTESGAAAPEWFGSVGSRCRNDHGQIGIGFGIEDADPCRNRRAGATEFEGDATRRQGNAQVLAGCRELAPIEPMLTAADA